ncbi:helicase associated domain-containing protein [Actinacidiphila glaucinigra]|uniref:helicase associated domain-containing protein n=1 Tax=Actinacidiphila glaucinigra TaxID=235986 RepID=UPI001FE64163|nr:helicase associated domain-containing protein [Actinacidiphila glaucinigra]
MERARRRERARSSQWTTTWASNLAAARQYAERGGHLDVPRSHVETIDGTAHTLGIFIANQRARRAGLAPERVAELTALGMRWG